MLKSSQISVDSDGAGVSENFVNGTPTEDENYRYIKSKRLALDRIGSRVTGNIVKQIKGLTVLDKPDREYIPGGTKEFYKQNPDLYANTQASLMTDGYTDLERYQAERGNYNSLAFGEAPVMNPLWQFGELDDVRSNPSYPRMGRVYNETIAANAPRIVFQPCREVVHDGLEINELFGFGVDGLQAKNLNNYIRSGGEVGFIRSALSLITNMVVGLVDFVKGIFGKNSFIEYKPDMKLFKRYCNEVYRELAANMNLLDWMDEEDPPTEGRYVEDDQGKASVEKDNYGGVGSSYRGTIPQLNLMQMLPNRKACYINYYHDNETGALITKVTPKLNNMWKTFHDHGYISYMCQRGITVSETFSNTTGEHPMVAEVNNVSSAMSNDYRKGVVGKALEGMKNLMSDPSLGGVYDSMINVGMTGVKNMIGSVASGTASLGLLFTGGGKAAFPEVWTNSSYSRSYSLSLKFFSPPGDTISIFENVYVPMVPLMVLAAPRQTAKNIYYGPFGVKVFSKGLFSIANGMIKSLSITRGEEKNDRTVFNYPRTLTVNIEIEDLTPVMMLSLGGSSGWFGFHHSNEGLHEYLATLGGLSIADRFAMRQRWDRFWSQTKAYWTDSVFNLRNLGYNIASSWIMKPIMMWGKGQISVDEQSKPHIY